VKTSALTQPPGDFEDAVHPDNEFAHNGSESNFGGFAFRFPVRQFQIQLQEEGQNVFFRFHAAGTPDGGVELGVGLT